MLPDPTTLTSNQRQPTSQQPANTAIANAMNQPMYTDVELQRASTAHPTDNNQHYALILDPDIVRDNPVEAKHRRLVRSHRNGPLDRDLKPNPKIRDELNVSLRSSKYNDIWLTIDISL